jgi:transcriptional regulator GlxA family with amidase domain
MYVECSTLDCLRIIEARILIESTDLPIEEIWRRLGFSNLEEFERKFQWLERAKPHMMRKGNGRSRKGNGGKRPGAY